MEKVLGAVRNAEMFRTACLFAGILCLLVMLPSLPMSFARVVAFAIPVVALWVVAACIYSHNTQLVIVFIAIAVSFNPFYQILQTALLIRTADVVAAAAFFFASSKLSPVSIGQTSTETDS